MKNSADAIHKPALIPAVGCYVLWGFFPVYWKWLDHIDALETLVHRVIWSFIFYYAIITIRALTTQKSHEKASWKDWGLAAITGILMSGNWWLFIYAINIGQIIETSLAYFINPLMVVAVGVIWFRESFPPLLKAAFVSAALGVGIKIAYGDIFPWIALTLAVSFCIYGAIKKIVTVGPARFSMMETAIVLPPALILAYYMRVESSEILTTLDWALLAGGGIVTGIPLLLFAIAAQKLPYSLMGMLQFIGPSIAFLLGYYVYHEAVSLVGWISFGFIWLGVLLYIIDRIMVARKLRKKSSVPLATAEEPR
jgi:chloramphenicol-sensitive protein RarD